MRKAAKRKGSNEDRELVSFRLSGALKDRIDRFAKNSPLGELTRTQVIVSALEAGLDVLERRVKS